MLTLCEKCRNHYDDTFQSVTCNGPARAGHRKLRSSPLEDHVFAVNQSKLDARHALRIAQEASYSDS